MLPLMFGSGIRITPYLSRTLDQTRWLAAALVLLYHIRINVLAEMSAVTPSNRGLIAWIAYTVGDCGPQAVIWFFMISGFLVGGKMLVDMRGDRFQFRRYAIDRITRLYIVLIPALFTGYILDLIRTHFYGINSGAGSETLASYGLWPIFANLLCFQTIDAPILGSNTPLWSLACEGWYYVLFPLLAVAWLNQSAGSTRRIVLSLAAAVIVALLAQHVIILQLFILWLMGVAVRFVRRPLGRSMTAAWSLAAICMVTYPLLVAHSKLLAALAVALSFGNVLLTAMYMPLNPRVSRTRLHTSLAGFSFSLYVTHAPIIHFLLSMSRNAADPRLALQPAGLTPLAWAVGLLALPVGYAWIFSLCTEANTNRVRAFLLRSAI